MTNGAFESGGVSGAAGPQSDWYALVDGQTLGPMEWGSLVGLVHGRRPDGVLVWHSSLQGWTPAVAIVPEPPKRRRPAWLVPVLIPLAALVAVCAVLGGLWGGGVFDRDVPLVDVETAAPTVVDTAYESTFFTATPDEGCGVSVGGMELEIPSGAVESETEIEVKTLTEPFHAKAGPPPDPTGDEGDVSAASIAGPVFDLGPDGLVFSKPVTLTLPYDEEAIPAGFPEDQTVFAYWNGEAWVLCPGLVDTERDTVTVELSEFRGLIATTTTGVVLVGSVIAATGIYIGHKLWESDPIYDGTAAEWITPFDPVVSGRAARAVLVSPIDPTDYVSLDGPDVADWISRVTKTLPAGERPKIGYKNPDGTVEIGVYDAGKGSYWQRPAHYFTTGTVKKGPLSGDCTDIGNATASVFRALDYQAKGVFGYQVDTVDGSRTAHAWAEVVIGGLPYMVDETGELWPLDARSLMAMNIVRPSEGDRRYQMWDEKGQQPYVDRWWTKENTTTTITTGTTATTGPGTPGTGQIPVEPGSTVEAVTETINPSDPSDIRVYVTYTSDSSIGDRLSVSVAVFEYRYDDQGVLSQKPSTRVYFEDVPLTATNVGDPLAAALARAQAQTIAYIAEQGLAAIVQ